MVNEHARDSETNLLRDDIELVLDVINSPECL